MTTINKKRQKKNKQTNKRKKPTFARSRPATENPTQET